jgi:hypothetical protein
MTTKEECQHTHGQEKSFETEHFIIVVCRCFRCQKFISARSTVKVVKTGQELKNNP